MVEAQNETTPLVSVIVTTRLRHDLLGETLASVVSQTFKDFEIIVINDGGESIEAVLAPFTDSAEIFPLRHEKSRGRGASANTALKAARGKYIAYLDAGEIYYPNHLEVLVSFLEENSHKIAYSDAHHEFREWITDRYVTTTKEVPFSADFNRRKLLVYNSIPRLNVVHARDILDDVGFFDENLETFEDWDFWIRISEQYDFHHVKEVTAALRTHLPPSSHEMSIDSVSVPDALKKIYARYRYEEDAALLRDRRRLESRLAAGKEKRWNLILKEYELLYEAQSELARINSILEGKNYELSLLRASLQEKESRLAQWELRFNEIDRHWDMREKRIGELDGFLRNLSVSKFWKLYNLYSRAKFFLYSNPREALGKIRESVKTHGAVPTLRRIGFYLRRGEALRSTKVQGLSLPGPEVYREWFEKNRASLTELFRQRDEILNWEDRPLISLIVPVYNTRPDWLEDLLFSIQEQTYDRWEALLVDDHSSSPKILPLLNKWAEKDKRFKVIARLLNGGVSVSCQDGLKSASGLFAAVVDHDDLLEPDALYQTVACLRSAPDADVIYSDEALTDKEGNILRLVFRPSYSYDRLLSHPYIVHFTAFRRELALSVGGFDPSFEVSQDYDLLLRLAAATDRFVHIPKVLYRWRQYGTSTGHQKLDKVMASSIKALSRHLELRGQKGVKAEPGLSFNFFRVRYPLRKALVSVIIPTRDRLDLLRRCIESLEEETELPEEIRYEIVIADNQSGEPETLDYFDELKRRGCLVVPCHVPFNFSQINNMAVRACNGDILLFLNNDIEIVQPSWMTALLEHAFRPEVGAVGAKLLYPDGLIQHAGVILGMLGSAGHNHQFFAEYSEGNIVGGYLDELLCIRESAAVTAACMTVRREVFEKVGGFNEKLAIGFGDTDLCLRFIQAGFKNVWTPYSRLIHYESCSRGKRGDDLHLHPADSVLFSHTWREWIHRGDPYYNSNLSLRSNNFMPKGVSPRKTPPKRLTLLDLDAVIRRNEEMNFPE